MTQEKIREIFISNPDPDARRNAAELLSNSPVFDDLTAELLVLGLKDEDIGVRDLIFRILQSRTGNDALLINKHLIPYIADTNIEIRNLSAELLKVTGVYDPSIIVPFFHSPDIHVRQFAVEICFAFSSDVIVKELKQMLPCEEISNVRASIIEAMGNFRDEEVEEILIRQFAVENDLKPVVIDSLAKFGTEKAESFIISVLDSDQDVFIKIACLDALSSFSQSRDLLFKLMKELLEFPESIRTMVLKSIVLISERIQIQIEINENMFSIARLALLEDDEKSVYAGLRVLNADLQLTDIPHLASAILSESNLILATTLEILLNLRAEKFIKDLFVEIVTQSYSQGSVQNIFSLLPEAISGECDSEAVQILQNVLFELLINEQIEPSVPNIDSLQSLDYKNFRLLIAQNLHRIPEEMHDII